MPCEPSLPALTHATLSGPTITARGATQRRSRRTILGAALLLGALLASCQSAPEAAQSPFSIGFEQFALENGLNVVLHVDESDPVVAVAMTYHVGSSREQLNKTGLAHLFEHLLFLDSENLGPGGLDVLINDVGGSLNGFTDRDRTTYYEVVPNDALEKVLWAEADRLGFFINTVTAEVLEKERQVVKNEKRQSYDNRPYGHTYTVIGDTLYPEGHPYSWQVIGSLEDLDRLTLEDVREFYDAWYAPNNATLVVAGDIDVGQTREWIEKYFGEIPSRRLPATPEPARAELAETQRLFHEDRLATLPELTLTWPTVPLYHPDSYALELLGALLSRGKGAPLYQVIVEDEALAPSVSMYTYVSEVAGELSLAVRGFAHTKLDDVERAVAEAFGRFEDEGFETADLDRLKAGYEIDFYSGYRGISSVLGKVFKLSEYSVLGGSPGYLAEDMARLLSVSEADVLRVYEDYIRDQPFVATSFVPEGQQDLALAGSRRAEIREEAIDADSDLAAITFPSPTPSQTPSVFDRSVQPPFGPTPSLRIPDVWTDSLPNGMRVYGTEDGELPVVRFSIRLAGGLLLDSPEKVGVANLTASLMNQGTANRTPEELEDAIEMLGSSVNISAGRESLTISVSTLTRSFAPTMALVQEMLLEPRWDAEEFALAKQQAISTLQRQETSPDAIAENTFNLLLYGRDHILSRNPVGTMTSVASITIGDLKDYYDRNFSPEVASMHVVGDISREEVTASLSPLIERWQPREVEMPTYPSPPQIDQPRVFFVDMPGATQSVVHIGAIALAETDVDFYPATIMNLRLGGSFVSDLVQILREQRGYTYGISSAFSGSRTPGPFRIRTSVRSDATPESLRIITDILRNYGDNFDDADLEATRSFLIRSNALQFETLNARVNMLEKISALDFPFDYVREREQIVREITLERVRSLAERYVNPERMLFVIVGDARTQLSQLSEAGLGDPVLIDINAEPLPDAEPVGAKP